MMTLNWNMSLRKCAGCFTLASVFGTLLREDIGLQTSPPHTVLTSRVYIFIFTSLFQITCKPFHRAGALWRRCARPAQPRTPAERAQTRRGRDCCIFRVLMSVRKKSAWILKVSLLLAYFFIVNIYILLTRWWKELVVCFFFCKNVLSCHIIMPFFMLHKW